MKLLLNWWKKLLYLLVTGSTSVFIAACYGPLIRYDINPWRIGVKDEVDAPVKGIQVRLYEYRNTYTAEPEKLEFAFTDDSGLVGLPVISNDPDCVWLYRAAISDIDSAENGGEFADTLIDKDVSDISEVVLRKVQ